MIKLTIVLLNIMALSIFCNGLDNTITGKWHRCDDPGKTVILNFDKNDKFAIEFPQKGAMYDGTYTYSHDTLMIVDKMCGTSLTGKYSVIRTGERIELKLISDPYCGRKDFYPAEWQRFEKIQ